MVASLRDCADGTGNALAVGIRAWKDFCRTEIAAGRAVDDPQHATLGAARSDADFLKLIGAEDLAERIERAG